MGFRLSLDAQAPMEAVLAAIHENTREWRESIIPPELREHHVLQVMGSVSDRRFELIYVGVFGYGTLGVVLRGTVEPTSLHSSTINVWCGIPHGGWKSALTNATVLVAILCIQVSWHMSFSFMRAMVVAAALIFGLMLGAQVLDNLFRQKITLEGSAPARYLVQRLKNAIAAAERDASAPKTSERVV